MGLLHAFVNWGIRLVDNTESDVRRIGQRLGYMPLSWQQTIQMYPTKNGILWRLPDPEVPMASSFRHTQALLVSRNEQVMLIRNGVLQGSMERGVLLSPGLYDLRRLQMREQIEVIWVTTRELRLNWGISDVLTRDRVNIGASGYYTLTISDPEAFLLNVAGHEQVYREEQLNVYVKSEVSTVLRDLLARTTVLEFQQAHAEFNEACREKLRPTFERWGLEFHGVTILNQHIPAQFLAAAEARTRITLEKEGELAGAQLDALIADYQAQASLKQGRTQIELMQQQQALGLNPLDLKRIEVAEVAAANPNQGTLLDDRAQLIGQLLNQPTLPPPLSGPIINGSFVPNNPTLPSLPAGHYNSGPLNSASANPGGTQGTGPMTREKVQEMIDKLDERLLAGEISEQKHSEMYARLQKRLHEL
ncbi:MAG TPA: SPFH domain-containing protein [Ktedonobacteraceae bacterium]|nr:SPFH domain-containing protein [Ktedonobacteraceae bacterium]